MTVVKLQVATYCDIEKVFHQIKIRPDDHDILRLEYSVLANWQIPRCSLLKGQIVFLHELRGFSDAFERVYAAAAYLKLKNMIKCPS